MRSSAAIIAVLSACGGSTAPASIDRRSTDAVAVEGREQPEPIDIELVADAASVGPGDDFILATRFVIQPGWHIYWINPGEAGLATEVDMAGPAGFVIGELRYPGPSRFESPGPVVSYGYAGVAALSAVVQVADHAGDGPYEFLASASWLACKDACIRGRADATLVIPRGPRAPAAHSNLADHAASLPRALDELGALIQWRDDGGQLELVIEIPGASAVELFPTEDHELTISGTAAIPAADGAILRVAYERAPTVARGVLAVTRDGAVSYYELALTPPGALGQ